jgi:methylated-DNA-[protein]-cysteine S-methyltransferase
MFVDLMPSPVGALLLKANDTHLLNLLFADKLDEILPTDLSSNAIIEQVKQELTEYFSGHRQTFDVPFQLSGTPFQKTVWEALLCVPYGKTATYGQQAHRINKPKAVRAVGTANGRNPISIIVPCHRIIGADGSLTGYGGGLPNKAWLLDHEGISLPHQNTLNI